LTLLSKQSTTGHGGFTENVIAIIVGGVDRTPKKSITCRTSIANFTVRRWLRHTVNPLRSRRALARFTV